MDGKTILKTLKKAGWKVVRIRGSHHFLFHSEQLKHVTLAVHGKKDLKIKTVKSIERSTGIHFSK